MPTIEAFQHIYVRLSSEQSPTGFDGYQTLFRTQPEISEEESRSIEERLFFFPVETSPPAKWVFFPSSAGNLVLGRITKLPDRDQHGRPTYMAHSLVMPTDKLPYKGVDPIAVFENFAWVTAMQDAMAFGDRSTNSCKACSLEMRSGTEAATLEEAGKWSGEQLRKLAFLIMRAPKLREQQTAIGLYGEPDDIAKVLGLAFLLVPRVLTAQCAFDTYFLVDKGRPCNLSATYCWAVGFDEIPGGINCVPVNAAARAVEQDLKWKPGTPFERWLAESIEATAWDCIGAQKDTVFSLSRFLRGESGNADGLRQAPDDLVQGIFANESECVVAHTERTLEGLVGKTIAKRLAAPLAQERRPRDLLNAMLDGFDPADMLNRLWSLYEAQMLTPPSAEEMASLGQVLRKYPHGLLQALVCIWTQESASLSSAVERLEPDQYSRLVTTAMRNPRLDTLGCVGKTHAGRYVDAYLGAGAPAHVPFEGLLEALLKARALEQFARLAGVVASQDAKTLKAVNALCKSHPEMPTGFRAAVEQARKSHGGLLKRLFRG